MAIPLEGRLWWRQTAPFHVQLELEKTEAVPQVLSKVRVHGRALRVFRTDGRLAAGDDVTFRLWVCRKGDEPTGEAYIYYDDLVGATYMEVYLHGTPPELEMAAYEFSVIDAPSNKPTLPVEELEDLLARLDKSDARTSTIPEVKRWWQLWKRSKQLDWVTKLHEPFFRNQENAEKYVTRELPPAVPEGWRISRPAGQRLTWVIKKERPEPGEWENQEYCVRVSNGLDFVILTHGNSDVGPFSLHHAPQNALTIEAVMLRRFSLGECLSFLFCHCKPNEWGYT